MNRDIDDVRESLASYVRATDRRDGAAMMGLFAPDAKLEIFAGHGDAAVKIGELDGPEAIGHAVGAWMQPHPPGGWSHHTTHDPLVKVDGDRATLDAQYIVFSSRSEARPVGAQGSVTPIEAGYYRSKLARIGGRWLFVHHRIDQDLAMVFPTGSSA